MNISQNQMIEMYLVIVAQMVFPRKVGKYRAGWMLSGQIVSCDTKDSGSVKVYLDQVCLPAQFYTDFSLFHFSYLKRNSVSQCNEQTHQLNRIGHHSAGFPHLGRPSMSQSWCQLNSEHLFQYPATNRPK